MQIKRPAIMRIKRATIFAGATVALTAFSWAADALDYKIADPVVHDNLAVYPIRSDAIGVPAPLTVERAARRGLVRIHRNEDSSVTMDNMSGQSIFVPFGTLLTGGLQDQVVRTGTILPPHARGAPLSVFCVDPFRTMPREHESADTFATSGALIPSRMAKLSMLLSSTDSKAIRWLRQSGVWWSIDALHSRLEKHLGTKLEASISRNWTPDHSAANPATTVLAERQSNWTASLPLALTDRRLRGSEASYLSAIAKAAHSYGNIIGAIFAINGQLVGAELYGSPELFQQMWPRLLRAYAVEAIAAKGSVDNPLPSIAAAEHFLFEAPSTEAHYDWVAGNHIHVREAQDVLYSEVADESGNLIETSYISKTLPDSATFTPDELVVDILAKRTLNGRNIVALDTERVDFRRSASGAWTATIPEPDNALTSPAASLVGGFVLLVLCAMLRALLPLRAHAPRWLGRKLSKMRFAAVRIIRAGVGLPIVAARRMCRAWSAMRTVMNRFLIPSPLAVFRMCFGNWPQPALRQVMRKLSARPGQHKPLGML